MEIAQELQQELGLISHSYSTPWKTAIGKSWNIFIHLSIPTLLSQKRKRTVLSVNKGDKIITEI
jgi:hypothetical protein